MGCVYECGVTRRFAAKHALIGDFGSESTLHSHNYRLEISVKGPSLDEDGFLVNLAELEEKSDEIVRSLLSYPSLNQVPGIKGKNPSAENLAAHVLGGIAQRIDLGPIESLTVTIWESESAWASCISSTEEHRSRALTWKSGVRSG
jgi:6-pyruvoyltetrahydropterin/6-carboxytetrahydropterin synthase